MDNTNAAQTSLGWNLKANNENPYSTEELATIDNDAPTASIIKTLTSIPSPYARFHLTEIALREAARPNSKFESLPPVYKRAISHCLDMFELFFKFDGLRLKEENIEIKRHKYEIKDFIGKRDLANQDVYLKALQLFRNNYRVDSQKFKHFFTISRVDAQGIRHLIGMTSPFTIFSTPEDLDGGYCSINVVENGRNVTLFQNDDDINQNSYWRGIEDREDDFKQFMYSLALKYNRLYDALWVYIDGRLHNYPNLNREVRFGQDSISKPYTISGKVGVPLRADNPQYSVEILPSSYDRFLFEQSFVNTEQAIDLSADNHNLVTERRLEIEARHNIFNGGGETLDLLQWITIDDLLEDVIFYTPNPIDTERYLALDSQPHIFLPVKKLYFKLFSQYHNGELIKQDELAERIEVKFEEGGLFDGGRSCIVTLILPQSDGGFLRISKTYAEECIHDISIDFGIYPFIRVNTPLRQGETIPENFYRVMAYFQKPLEHLEEDIKLYACDSRGLICAERIDKNVEGYYHIQRHHTITSANYPQLNDNLYYISLESTYLTNSQSTLVNRTKDVRFDIVELTLDNHHLLVVPRFKIYNPNNLASTNVAIDLGTSNTYVAYSKGDKNCAFEEENGEIVIGKLCRGGEQNYDFTQNGCHQWCEFLPTEFGPNTAHFPIRTVQLWNPNVLSDNELQKMNHEVPLVSMSHMNIPFRLEDMGSRSIGENTIDYQLSNFKMFSSGQNNHRNTFKLFIDQLCFMLHTKLLYGNFDINHMKLGWTYPLVLPKENLSLFQTQWKDSFLKYFRQPNEGDVVCFTESETPVNCAQDAQNFGKKVGIDIGGGTSDVILYNASRLPDGNVKHEILMASSFAYAGNVMFGQIGNRADMNNNENVWYQMLKDFIPDQDDKKNSNTGLKRKIVDASPNGRNIADFMNYIFAHPLKEHDADVRYIFTGKSLRFLNLYHISALVWEVAKVCKNLLGKREMPKYIVFSGNGSRLILLDMPVSTEEERRKREEYIGNLVRNIFGWVYNKVDHKEGDPIVSPRQIETVEMLQSPKRATAEGALALMQRNEKSNTEGKYYIPFAGHLYHENPNQFTVGTVTHDMEEPAMSSQDSFGAFGEFNFDDEPSKPIHEEPASEPVEQRIDHLPKFSEIEKNRDKLLDEYNEFFEAFKQLFNMPDDLINSIKKSLFGSYEDIHTEQAYKFIRDMSENYIKPYLNDNQEFNESMFLMFNACVIAELVKKFAPVK